jgi:DNA-directed RNA polymerase subunit beta
VRDVTSSHYGRLCPIETPEGTNIGLISSLVDLLVVDDYGFLVTPYRRVKKGKVTDEVVWLRADEEIQVEHPRPADTPVDDKGVIVGSACWPRYGEPETRRRRGGRLHGRLPMQIVGVSASLIPFLEHDDANRALMGSNMQRQAVPLLIAELPLVGTGMEDVVARNSGMVVRAPRRRHGHLRRCASHLVDDDEYALRKFVGLNERPASTRSPIVKEGDKVKAGQVLADGPTQNGELALGKNVLVAFMTWDGYNFEDAIIALASAREGRRLHVDPHRRVRRSRSARPSWAARSSRATSRTSRRRRCATSTRAASSASARASARRHPGRQGRAQVQERADPEEKLLHAIFGRAGEDVKNDSLEVPTGVEGIVIDAEKFSRKVNLTETSAKNLRRSRGRERTTSTASRP